MTDKLQRPPQAAPIAEPLRPTATRADITAAAVAWIGIVLGVVIKLAFAGWFLFWLIPASPVVVGVPVAGAVVLNGVLLRGWPRGRSWSVVPARYRVLAWVLGLAFLLAGASMVDGGDDGETRSGLAALLGQDHAPQTAEVAFYAWWVAAIAAVVSIVWFVVDRRSARARTTTAAAELD